LNADNLTREHIPQNAFVVYQGSHGDIGASLANVILPGCAYTEKDATFVNTEGRVQQTRKAVSPPGAAREDWMILRALAEVAGINLPYDDKHDLCDRIDEVAPHLNRTDSLEHATPYFESLKNVSYNTENLVEILDRDFYLTDPICRASSTMAKCSNTFTEKKTQKTATASQ
jgi:NADH dehydrogenase (ubiquinone) Fe-S protein 1